MTIEHVDSWTRLQRERRGTWDPSTMDVIAVPCAKDRPQPYQHDGYAFASANERAMYINDEAFRAQWQATRSKIGAPPVAVERPVSFRAWIQIGTQITSDCLGHAAKNKKISLLWNSCFDVRDAMRHHWHREPTGAEDLVALMAIYYKTPARGEAVKDVWDRYERDCIRLIDDAAGPWALDDERVP